MNISIRKFYFLEPRIIEWCWFIYQNLSDQRYTQFYSIFSFVTISYNLYTVLFKQFFFLVILGDIRRSLFSMGLGIEDFFRIAFQPSKCPPTCLFLEYTKVFRPERFVTSTTSYEIDKLFSMSQGHLFVSLLFWGLHFIFYRDFSLSVLLVKTSFWNSSRMLKLMIFWYQKFSEKSVQKVTCLKVTHFWEFGRTQNASLFSTTV